jgi:hypothetical protein
VTPLDGAQGAAQSTVAHLRTRLARAEHRKISHRGELRRHRECLFEKPDSMYLRGPARYIIFGREKGIDAGSRKPLQPKRRIRSAMLRSGGREARPQARQWATRHLTP